jgi:hypothetical protein
MTFSSMFHNSNLFLWQNLTIIRYSTIQIFPDNAQNYMNEPGKQQKDIGLTSWLFALT